MGVLKFIILAMIFLSSVLIGTLISRRYENRVIELKEIKNALNMLKTKIKFTYEPLPDIFNQIETNLKPNIAKIFGVASKKMRNCTVKEAWETSITEATLNINEEDTSILRSLGKMLRQNRCWWSNKWNRTYKLIYRYANKQSRRREKEKRKDV